MTTRYLICGGRDFTDKAMLDRALDKLILHPTDAVIVQGGANGADALASAWGWAHGAKVESYPALWEKFGKSAGPIRNREMLDVGKPDVVLAFPGGKGTWNMVIQSRERRLVTVQVVA